MVYAMPPGRAGHVGGLRSPRWRPWPGPAAPP
jgi:hypothetical protein